MLPLRDSPKPHRRPVVTLTLIGLCALAFVWELFHGGQQLAVAFYKFGLVPARYTRADVAREFAWHFGPGGTLLPFLTSMFLHGSWLHLLGNLWMLWIFGDNVEDRLGHVRYLGLYLGSGFAAALVHVLTNMHSVVPTIGASGAVAGIMGAYFRFFPHSRLDVAIPPFFLGPFFEIPAVLFLGFWFLLQFVQGTTSLGGYGQSHGGIAWWAHVGGFLFGLAMAALVREKPKVPPFLR